MIKKMNENMAGKNLKSILRRTETELNICCYYDRKGERKDECKGTEKYFERS